MSSKPSTEDDRTKKPYERPELVVYGDIRQLTQAIAGSNTIDSGGHGIFNRTS